MFSTVFFQLTSMLLSLCVVHTFQSGQIYSMSCLCTVTGERQSREGVEAHTGILFYILFHEVLVALTHQHCIFFLLLPQQYMCLLHQCFLKVVARLGVFFFYFLKKNSMICQNSTTAPLLHRKRHQKYTHTPCTASLLEHTRCIAASLAPSPLSLSCHTPPHPPFWFEAGADGNLFGLTSICALILVTIFHI